MRLNEPASDALVFAGLMPSGAVSVAPAHLIRHRGELRQGRITAKCSSRFRSTKVNANTATRMTRNATYASRHLERHRIGTETICAPTTSLSFQPKPLPAPYSDQEAGASAGVSGRPGTSCR